MALPNRFVVFLLGLVAWWAIAIILWGPQAISFVLIFGTFYALPMSIFALIADVLAPKWFPKRTTLGFVLLAFTGLAGFLMFIQFGPGAPSNKPFYTSESASYFLINIGIPTFALIAVHVVANIGWEVARTRKPESRREVMNG